MNQPMFRLALVCLFLVSCSDDTDKSSAGGGKTDAQLERGFVGRLRECQILGAGIYNDAEIEDDYDRCVARCVIEAECAELEVACHQDERPPANGYVICALDCYDSTVDDQFECNDGSRVPHSFVCDLNEDCEDGEDEGRAECGKFTCDDGEVLAASRVECDGIDDCGDASDEKGCATFCE